MVAIDSMVPNAAGTVVTAGASGFVGRAGRPMIRVAVVGAGIAGLACARELADHSIEVTVFDKGRGVGGRATTRRLDGGSFDLGAQYFTVRDSSFADRVRSWIDQGVCAVWEGRIVSVPTPGATPEATAPAERFVGTPGMSALARHLAAALDVRRGHRVERIARAGDRFVLSGTVAAKGVTLPPADDTAPAADAFGDFDRVLICTPAPQAARLVEPLHARFGEEARSVSFDPCFAVGFAPHVDDEPLLRAISCEGAFIGRDDGEDDATRSALSWVAREGSKPGRPPGERWVLHASSAWSRRWFDAPSSHVASVLVEEFARAFGLRRLQAGFTDVRRWAYAKARHPLDSSAFYDDELGVGLGGDWASGGRVEGAYVSGRALGLRVLGRREG